jgi:hypothetical protein
LEDVGFQLFQVSCSPLESLKKSFFITLIARLLAEKVYVRPDEFIPERWYSRPELVLDKNGFTPFSIGM